MNRSCSSARRMMCSLLCLSAISLRAQNTIHIDATAPVPALLPVAARLGTARAPDGRTIAINSQYLTLDGQPWIPVMGEFHFSRYPAEQWEQEILKMKSAGVQIISTYVIWIHHEQTQGNFAWSGQRDLRRFVELCGKHGMYVYPRIGPWAHAEVRNGGLPDWVMKAGPIRQNDPIYLAEVRAFYAQIAAQLKGQLWKDGGPVIGIQIENEYRGTGPGKGSEHIRTLKDMALADGLDVPLYTVTGWDGAAIPLDAVLPVFGGYPDAPWDASPHKLPPNEVYAFRFSNRSAGNMGAIGGRGQNAAISYTGTPFLTAEVGDGIEDTYFRRPVVSVDDVAAIPTVMLGSGANLLGYYMFHGGRNPEGGDITLQESQATGYATDVPEKSYDFQAPLGEYGQEAASLRRLKLVHYFLADFGAQLAPMTPRTPGKVPASPADSVTPRVSARTSGDHGFLFLNNHVRGLDMPTRKGFQVELALPSGVVRIPDSPIDIPADSYGIWPVNMPLKDTILHYSTAQPFKRVDSAGQTYFFFFALPGIAPEFVLDSAARVIRTSGDLTKTISPTGLHLRFKNSGGEVRLSNGVHIVLLSEADAENVWKVDDPSLLLQTPAFAFSNGSTWTLQSLDQPDIRFSVFGATQPPSTAAFKLQDVAPGKLLVFHPYEIKLPPVTLTPTVTKLQDASPRAAWKNGPLLTWRKNPVPMAPEDTEFAGAAAWKIAVPALPPTANLSDAFLHISWQGDVAHLQRGDHLLDDDFWNGTPWVMGLRELGDSAAPKSLEAQSFGLRILPLPEHFPMYLENAPQLHFANGVAATLGSVAVVPQYQLVLTAPIRP